MAIALRALGTAATGTSTSPAAVMPASLAVNDVAFMIVTTSPNATSPSLTAPTGFTAVSSAGSSANYSSLRPFYRRVTATTESSTTITATLSVSATWRAQIIVFSGMQTGMAKPFIDLSPSSTLGAATTTTTIPATLDQNQRSFFAVSALATAVTSTFTSNIGGTVTTSNSSGVPGLALAYNLSGTTGSSPTIVSTQSAAGYTWTYAIALLSTNPYLIFDFESGTVGSAPTATTTGSSQIVVNGTTLYTAQNTWNGGKAIQWTASGTNSIIRWLAPSSTSQTISAGVAFSVDVAVTGTNSPRFISLNNSTYGLSALWNASNQLVFQDSTLTGGVTMTTSRALAIGERYYLTLTNVTSATTTTGSFTAKLYDIYGTLLGTVSASNFNFGTTAWVSVDLGFTNTNTVAGQKLTADYLQIQTAATEVPFPVRTSVSATVSDTYDVRTSLTATNSDTYSVKTSASSSDSDTYSVRSLVTKSSSDTYNVAANPVTVYNSAEGAPTDGSAVSTANSVGGGTAFTNVYGTPTYQNAAAYAGQYGIRIPLDQTTRQAVTLQTVETNRTQAAARGYFYFTSLPSSPNTRNFIEIGPANLVQGAQVGINSSGFLQTTTLMSSGDSGTVPMPLNTWVRVEMSYNSMTGALQAAWFVGNSLTPGDTVNTTSGTLQTLEMGFFGKWSNTVAGPAGHFMYVDGLAFRTNSMTFIGPGPMSLTVTDSDTYGVRTSVSATSSDTYGVRSTASTAVSTTWDVKYRVIVTDSDTYSVKTAVSTSDSDTYSVKKTVSATDSDTWDVLSKTNVGTSVSDTYAVRTTVNTSISDTYSVKSSVSVTNSDSYNVLTSLQKTISDTYGVRTSVSTSMVTFWTTYALVFSTSSDYYSVRQRVQIMDSDYWSAKQTITKTQSTTWNQLNSVETSISTTWTTYKTVSKTVQERYGVLQSVTPVSDSDSWTTYKAVTASVSTDWGVRTSVMVEVSDSYAVAAAVAPVTVATSWDVRQVVLDQVSDSYNVLTTTEKSVSDTYGVRTSASQSIDTTWAVRQSILQNVFDAYNVRARVNDSVFDRYKVYESVEVTQSDLWNVYAAVFIEISTSWDTRNLATFENSDTYAVRQRVVKLRSTTWRVLNPTRYSKNTAKLGTHNSSENLAWVTSNKNLGIHTGQAVLPGTSQEEFTLAGDRTTRPISE